MQDLYHINFKPIIIKADFLSKQQKSHNEELNKVDLLVFISNQITLRGTVDHTSDLYCAVSWCPAQIITFPVSPLTAFPRLLLSSDIP